MIEEMYLLDKIKKLPKVYKKYTYDNEVSVNPFYYDLEHSPSLCFGESRIWALRTDLIIAVGIKNAYDKARGSTIFDRADASVHHYINQDDRYGHPSLITPYENYDGSVYIAGWVYQHEDHLEVIMWSGRYSNENLTPEESKNLEQYLALKFMRVWGEQKIFFLHCLTEHLLMLFFNGLLVCNTHPYRIYDSFKSILKEILHNCIVNFEVDYSLKIIATYPYLKDIGEDINKKNANNQTALLIASPVENYMVRLLKDIVCIRVNEILRYRKNVPNYLIELIVKQFHSIDEQNSFMLLCKCKEIVIRNFSMVIDRYRLQIEQELIRERKNRLKRLIQSGYLFLAVNMLRNEYNDLINMVIDECVNKPLIYRVLKNDYRLFSTKASIKHQAEKLENDDLGEIRGFSI